MRKASYGPNARLPFDVRIVGVGGSARGDLYFNFLKAPWSLCIAIAMLFYALVNLLFGTLYYLAAPSIGNADPNSFLDHFFFSVQTIGTIGYGYMYPATTYANAVVTVEAFIGLFFIAALTGLGFAKISRPKARIRFSKHAVAHASGDTWRLSVRIGNERANHVPTAEVRLSYIVGNDLPAGDLPRPVDLKLRHQVSQAFTLGWVVMHDVTPDGPLAELLHGRAPERGLLLCSFEGVDGTTGQVIHAERIYTMDEILVGQKFAEILVKVSPRSYLLDFARFDTTIPTK